MLGKLWRTRNGVRIKTFPLELLVIVVLRADTSGTLEDRFRRVLMAFADGIDDLKIEDPANPTGNDLSHALSDKLRREISKIARDTLDAADEQGWEHVFGAIETKQAAIPRVQILLSAAAAAPVATKPWSCEG